MKQKIMVAAIMTIMLFAIGLLAGCDSNPSPNGGTYMRITSGFDSEDFCPENPYNGAIAFVVEESEFFVGENISVNLYVGPGSSYILTDGLIAVRATVTMNYAAGVTPNRIYGESVIIQEIEDFTLEKYLFNATHNLFPPVQQITVPAEWFAGEMGSIGFGIMVTYIYECGLTENFFGGRSLFYRVFDGKVILSSSSFSNEY